MPKTNGRAERFIKTTLEEWAYARPYGTAGQRLWMGWCEEVARGLVVG